MGIGDILKAAAPIAAGYFAPGAGSLFGNATANAIAAGAATGAGIAALSGQDVLGGAFTGGLGGMSGGAMGTAAAKTAAGTTTTAEANKLAMSGGLGSGTQAAAGSFNPALTQSTGLPPLTGGAATGANMAQGPNMGFVGQTQKVASGGGYNPSAFGRSVESAQAALREPGEFLSQLGDGSKAMGAGKLGITGLGVAGQAGAFDPDMPEYVEDKYDPKARLNLNFDTGLNLNRPSKLRLFEEGGEVKNFFQGGIPSQKEQQKEQLAAYGITPQYSMGMKGGRTPVMGNVGVGGTFVPNPQGTMTDIEYEKEYGDIIFDKEKDGSSTDQSSALDPQKAKSAGVSLPGAAGVALGLAKSYAEEQNNPELKAQTLGLESLQAGGYLETGGEVGDGMSDEIEATIEGTQEARLSDGEFVIPADVVSHLGNGSSDAGAKRLYEMMDKVRMARTGNKKQGKEIKPERYMPA